MKPRPSPAPATSGMLARLRPHLTRLTVFLIVFSVGYSVGIMSSSSIRPSPKPSQTVIRPHAAHLTASTAVPATNGSAAAAANYPRSPPHDLFRFREECAEAIPSDAVVRTLLDKLFDGESPYDSFPPPHTAALLHPAKERPRGWGSTGAVFAELIEEVRPDVIVELGAFLGASALHMAAWGIYADLIEVDAGHDFHSAWADINLAWAVLRPGGVMFGHDYFTAADDRGVRRAVTLFARVKGLTVRPHSQHWVLSPKPLHRDGR
uniref:Methyltransferase n=1 Tax=Oryza brachyantha TaxID=4533 RepID=J3MZA1_ORYBR